MKHIKIIAVLAALAAAAAIVTAVAVRSDRNTGKFMGELYFFNETATAIESETRQIRYKDEEDLPREVVEALMKGPDNSRYRRIIEKKTKIISIDTNEDGSVLVNLSREFITGDGRKDILAVYAVVKSLCAAEGIDSVKVIIEGRDIVTGDGEIIGYLTNEDINLPTDTVSTEMRDIILYFPQNGQNVLKREVHTVRVTDQQPLAQYIINELIKGPQSGELDASLSKDTVLLSVETSENICFVNFKSTFSDKNSGTPETEKMTIFSIVDSLTELDAIDRVQFLIDGKKVDMFGNINIGGMFGRDESLIADGE